MLEENKKPLKASKWLKLQALLDSSEITAFFETLGSFSLYLNGSICKPEEVIVPKEQFFMHYNRYIQKIKSGERIDPAEFTPHFSLMMSISPEMLFQVSLSENECLMRCSAPVVIMQAHQIHYSSEDKKFRSMMFGTECIPWGIQFSYPQLYQHPETNEIEKSSMLKNAQLFHAMQKWMRTHTIPTPFVVEKTPYNVPIRLGRGCLPWINRHISLKKQGVAVRV